jgi:hypothetical protein
VNNKAVRWSTIMLIFVKVSPDNLRFNVEVDLLITIRELCELITAKFLHQPLIDCSKIRVVFSGKQLKHDSTLQECKIFKECNLHMIIAEKTPMADRGKHEGRHDLAPLQDDLKNIAELSSVDDGFEFDEEGNVKNLDHSDIPFVNRYTLPTNQFSFKNDLVVENDSTEYGDILVVQLGEVKMLEESSMISKKVGNYIQFTLGEQNAKSSTVLSISDFF